MRPDLKFLLSHPAHFIALGFGAGLAPFAAGTWGTLAAFPIYWLLVLVMQPLAIALLCVPLFFIGVWASATTARNMKVKDPNAICWDEIVAFLPLLALTHDSIALQVLAFFAFRLFDVVKLPPASWVDQHVEGGFGIMLDDLFAAMYTYVVIGIAVIAAQKMGW